MDENTEKGNINEEQVSPQRDQYQPVSSSGDSGSKGPVVGVVIILLVLIAGAVYMWVSRNDLNLPFIGGDEVIRNLEDQSDSDEIEKIEEDLLSTELEGLDSELSDIETELEDL